MIVYLEVMTDTKKPSVYFQTPKEQRQWIISTVSEFKLEQKFRYYLLVRNVVGDGALVDVGAAGTALNLDKLNDNMILTLIALALDVQAGTQLAAS